MILVLMPLVVAAVLVLQKGIILCQIFLSKILMEFKMVDFMKGTGKLVMLRETRVSQLTFSVMDNNKGWSIVEEFIYR